MGRILGARRGRHIRTISGQRFWPLDPRPREVSIHDVAWALSNLCRFTGHVREFYSVAQHCCGVADFVRDEAWRQWPEADPKFVTLLALEGLLHDATEAYLNDLSTPVKHQPELSGYRLAEERLRLAIAERFGLPTIESPLVKLGDRKLLVTEARDLVPFDEVMQTTRDEVGGALPGKVVPWAPAKARAEFLTRFWQAWGALGRSQADIA